MIESTKSLALNNIACPSDPDDVWLNKFYETYLLTEYNLADKK